MTLTTMKRAALGVAISAMIGTCALAQGVDASKFLTEAMQTDLAEIEMGKLAEERGDSRDVKEYGEKLQMDHTRALEETSGLARTLGVAVPTEPKPEAKQHHAALSRLSGAEFDTAFVSHMVMGHQEAIAKFSEQTRATSNQEVSALATKRMPTLREHLAIAESLQETTVQGTHPAGGGAGNQRPAPNR